MFWNTQSGKVFFSSHLPTLINQLGRIAHELKRHNDKGEENMKGIGGNKEYLEFLVKTYGDVPITEVIDREKDRLEKEKKVQKNIEH